MPGTDKQIVINGKSILGDIQQAFTDFYPFLKIEFLKPVNLITTSANEKLDPHTSLQQVIMADTMHKLDVNNYRTVAMVSDDIDKALGLIAQLSRKSGKVWNIISFTDAWTLERQNSAGEFVSSIMGAPGAPPLP